MASRQELRALITIAGRIDPSLQSAMLRASGESMRLSNNLRNSANGLNRVSTIAQGTFLGAIAAEGLSFIASRVAGVAAESVKLASDLTEVQNVVDTTFGKSSNQIDAWSKTALSAYGLSELQAKQFSGTMGAMLKSTGITGEGMVKMSKNLAGLSGDLASFYNLDQETAFEKIRSGISGETEPLKQLGINMSVANMEAYAMSQGIKTSYAKMDQASQSILRYNYLLSVSKDAQGDFNRTQGGFANQQRLFDTNMKQLGATVATQVLPYLTQFLQYANKWAQNVDVGKVTKDVANAFTIMGDGIRWAKDNSNWLIPAVAGVAGSMAALEIIGTVTKLYRAWTATTFAMTWAQYGFNAAMTANPIGLVVVGIGLLVAAGVALWQNWDWVMAKGKELFAWIGKVAEPIKNFFGGGYQSNSTLAYEQLTPYASGGIASSPSIFGEAGEEMAIPLQRTPRSLGLLQQTASILGVGGSNSSGSKNEVNITYAPVIQGGSGPEVQSALNTSYEQFKVWAEEYFGDKGRVAFE
ncbi:hypothetical protein E4K67_17470 [Desulfosporosinus fructosivorans]|uniref:Phage tail tape measure protein n=1 Tax=Desulfosporosinus fructosivorans TaxID=2018669 RepID=A0A4Z0R327_9FIRM|nr:hypothetical protein [Desulfosporosinus fructosivorans]TGE36889.1 hypothetical protein E4K67_17470 [Desulfosporosinus fructosivorans]